MYQLRLTRGERWQWKKAALWLFVRSLHHSLLKMEKGYFTPRFRLCLCCESMSGLVVVLLSLLVVATRVGERIFLLTPP